MLSLGFLPIDRLFVTVSPVLTVGEAKNAIRKDR